MVDWIEKLLERFGDDEREEDGLLPDWRLELSAPGLPPEQGIGGEAEKYGRAGSENGADAGSAETDAWDAPDGMMGRSWTKDGPEHQKKPENDGENGYSDMLNGGLWLDGAAKRRAADGTPRPGRQMDEAGELELGADLDGPAWALSGSAEVLSGAGRKGATEGYDGTVWTGGTAAEIPVGWAATGIEGAKVLAELDKAARSAVGGVKWLYRQTAAAEWPTAPGLTMQTVRQAEREIGPAALTLEELDRAVRRDSRRYDGEMSIF